ncbi:mRNA 3'-end-processing protein rna14 [Rhizophlyctis rosea]|nr:mRNA 3'-end-processing protein rna14 [Rhizophlyctis rosea]
MADLSLDMLEAVTPEQEPMQPEDVDPALANVPQLQLPAPSEAPLKHESSMELDVKMEEASTPNGNFAGQPPNHGHNHRPHDPPFRPEVKDEKDEQSGPSEPQTPQPDEPSESRHRAGLRLPSPAPSVASGSGITRTGPLNLATMDRIDRLRIKTQRNPWDADSWTALLSESQLRGDPALVRSVFEGIVTQFPTAPRFWIAYAEFEQKQKDFERMEAIFRRCLLSVVSVDLWRFYLNYIRRTHSGPNVTPDKKQEARNTIKTTFEYVLQHIGNDKDSGYIWSDYLFFTKSGEAKKFLSEKSAGYMTARTAYKELKNLLDPIDKVQKTWVAKPPTWNEKDLQMLRAWKAYIAWEKSNPLGLEDNAAVNARVIYAYKSALLMLRFYPEIWHDAAKYMQDAGKVEEAAALLTNGVKTMPTSLLLNFTLIQLEESRRRDFAILQKHFDNLIEAYEGKLEEINTRYDEERERLLATLRESDADKDKIEMEWDGERREREREKQKEREKEVQSRVEEKRKLEVDECTKGLSLVWIVFMRIARRAQNIKVARQVFTRARKQNCSYHVYVAAAMMELYCNRDSSVAGRIFEVGLKAFNLAEDEQAPKFVLEYLDFLISLNDDNNTRALFERALSSLPPERARGIWAKFLDYENQYGDLASVMNIEKRRAEVYPDDEGSISHLKSLADRWQYLDIRNIAETELGIAAFSGETSDAQTLQATATPHTSTPTPMSRPQGRSDRIVPEREYRRENYPRPDFTKWTVYKPEVAAKGNDERRASDAGAVGSPAAPFGAPGSKPSEDVKVPLIPEPVARFLTSLPPAKEYNGPIIPIQEIIDLLTRMPIPLPPVQIPMVPVPAAAVVSRPSSTSTAVENGGGGWNPQHRPSPGPGRFGQSDDGWVDRRGGAGRGYDRRDGRDRDGDRGDRRFVGRGGGGYGRGGPGGGGRGGGGYGYKRKGYDDDDDQAGQYKRHQGNPPPPNVGNGDYA